MAKFCTNCGKQLGENDNACSNCGTFVRSTENNQFYNSDDIYTMSNQNIPTSEQKSKITAGLLGIFLGCFGVHNFYLGFTGKAIAQLLITVLSCFVLSFVSGTWALIESILILTGSINQDAKGTTLKD